LSITSRPPWADVLFRPAFRHAHPCTVEAGEISNEHKARAENAERGGEAEALLSLKENRRWISVVNPHDGCASALQVAAVVEIGDDYIVRAERPTVRKSLRHESDAIRIDVTVGRDSRVRERGRWSELRNERRMLLVTFVAEDARRDE